MNKIIKVIKIPSEFEIVINTGAEDGVKKGDIYQILSEGEEIFDPDTNESLGTLDTIKAEVVADDVLPHMTICRDYETITKKIPSPTLEALASFGSHFSYTTSEETQLVRLNVNLDDISGGLDKDKTIKIGDIARKKSY